MSEHRRFVAPAPADPGTTFPGLEKLREARAWLIAAQMSVVAEVLVDYLADVGPLAAQRALMAGQAPHEVAALMHGPADAGQPLLAGERTGARLVTPEDEEWPAALRGTGLLAPLGLWVRGPARLDDVLQRAVTVIGARASTAYGEHVAGDLGAGLADRGWTVVSGEGWASMPPHIAVLSSAARAPPSWWLEVGSIVPTRIPTPTCSGTSSTAAACWSRSSLRGPRPRLGARCAAPSCWPCSRRPSSSRPWSDPATADGHGGPGVPATGLRRPRPGHLRVLRRMPPADQQRRGARGDWTR